MNFWSSIEWLLKTGFTVVVVTSVDNARLNTTWFYLVQYNRQGNVISNKKILPFLFLCCVLYQILSLICSHNV